MSPGWKAGPAVCGLDVLRGVLGCEPRPGDALKLSRAQHELVVRELHKTFSSWVPPAADEANYRAVLPVPPSHHHATAAAPIRFTSAAIFAHQVVLRDPLDVWLNFGRGKWGPASLDALDEAIGQALPLQPTIDEGILILAPSPPTLNDDNPVRVILEDRDGVFLRSHDDFFEHIDTFYEDANRRAQSEFVFEAEPELGDDGEVFSRLKERVQMPVDLEEDYHRSVAPPSARWHAALMEAVADPELASLLLGRRVGPEWEEDLETMLRSESLLLRGDHDTVFWLANRFYERLEYAALADGSVLPDSPAENALLDAALRSVAECTTLKTTVLLDGSGVSPLQDLTPKDVIAIRGEEDAYQQWRVWLEKVAATSELASASGVGDAQSLFDQEVTDEIVAALAEATRASALRRYARQEGGISVAKIGAKAVVGLSPAGELARIGYQVARAILRPKAEGHRRILVRLAGR